MNDSWVAAEWPAPPGIVAGSTTRLGGVSRGSYASFNIALHVGDLDANVVENRRRLAALRDLPSEPRWLGQVHGATVLRATAAAHFSSPPPADAIVTRDRGVVCAVMTADCLPILFCAADGSEVAAAHAGWRGLAAGVVEQAVAAMSAPPAFAWFGPAISQGSYEVGADVRDVFVSGDPGAAGCFEANARGRWQADLYALARRRLAACGVGEICGGDFCTFTDDEHFFSHRRDGRCGRMATIVFRR